MKCLISGVMAINSAEDRGEDVWVGVDSPDDRDVIQHADSGRSQ